MCFANVTAALGVCAREQARGGEGGGRTKKKKTPTPLYRLCSARGARTNCLRAPAVSLEHTPRKKKKEKKKKTRCGGLELVRAPAFSLVRCPPHVSARANRASVKQRAAV